MSNCNQIIICFSNVSHAFCCSQIVLHNYYFVKPCIYFCRLFLIVLMLWTFGYIDRTDQQIFNLIKIFIFCCLVIMLICTKRLVITTTILPIYNNNNIVATLVDVENPEQNCSICLEKIVTNAIITKCNHVFHRQCITAHIRNNATCPNCRTPFINSE